MRTRVAAGLAALLLSTSVPAWEKHQALMPGILSGLASSEALNKPYPAPCAADDQAMYQKLAQELQLNPQAPVLPTAAEACARKQTVTGREILAGTPVDDPDDGMDRDLPYPPESYDPEGFQKWMGGSKGPTSQGFRHMYFGGWQLWHPIRTFQIPASPVGYAPARAATMAIKAREMIHRGGMDAAWGYRVLGWALHYVQDLAQPFHAVQIPDLRMVPWYAALQWPPKAGFGELVRETTRTISNYHWAFEQYTLKRLGEERSPYAECVAQPDAHSVLSDDPRKEETLQDPLLLAHRTARASVTIGHDVGRAMTHFFGAGLKARGVDLPAERGTPDYAEMAVRPDLYSSRDELARVTCKALSNASWASRVLIQWATQP
jgi:hypothetical protein